MVQKGLLGKIKHVTVGINGSPTGGPFPVADVPKDGLGNVAGAGSCKDFREKRCHYQFRWWYEYSGGKFTDWGAHHVDIAMWALDKNGAKQGPTSIDGTNCEHPVKFENGNPTVEDSYNTSHKFSVIHTLDDGITMDVTSHGDNGITFEGEKGRIFVNRGKITGTPIEENWDKERTPMTMSASYTKGNLTKAQKQLLSLYPRRWPDCIRPVQSHSGNVSLPFEPLSRASQP